MSLHLLAIFEDKNKEPIPWEDYERRKSLPWTGEDAGENTCFQNLNQKPG
jgi:hypothetical protein